MGIWIVGVYAASVILANLLSECGRYILKNVVYSEEYNESNYEDLWIVFLFPGLNTILVFVLLFTISYTLSRNIFTKKKLAQHPENISLLKLIKIYRYFEANETSTTKSMTRRLRKAITMIRSEKPVI